VAVVLFEQFYRQHEDERKANLEIFKGLRRIIFMLGEVKKKIFQELSHLRKRWKALCGFWFV
jgi:hypothetical protein